MALGRPLVQAFTTGDLAEAAPVLSLVDPPDGAAGVIRNLRALTVAWSKPMPPARFELVRDDGLPWPSHSDGLRVVLDRMLDAIPPKRGQAAASLLCGAVQAKAAIGSRYLPSSAVLP